VFPDLKTGPSLTIFQNLTISWIGKHPGRCLIGIDVTLPSGTVLAEPLTDDCLWRQGRGSLVELSTFDGELMSHKVSSGLPK